MTGDPHGSPSINFDNPPPPSPAGWEGGDAGRDGSASIAAINFDDFQDGTQQLSPLIDVDVLVDAPSLLPPEEVGRDHYASIALLNKQGGQDHIEQDQIEPPPRRGLRSVPR